MSLDDLRPDLRSKAKMGEWLSKKTGPQLAVLRWHFKMKPEESMKRSKAELQERLDELGEFYLAQRFARRKLKDAIIDFAERRLPAEVMTMASTNSSVDHIALVFGLFSQRWQDLTLLYQVEKIHRKGFARMRLKKESKRPKQSLSEALGPEDFDKILDVYDEQAGDGRRSQFKSHLPYDGTDLVFIRRAERAAHVMIDDDLISGFSPEWIILDFRHGAACVNICSESIRPSLEIANAIASAYYGLRCEYQNDRAITYPEQWRRLLKALIEGHAQQLTLAEVRATNSPFDGAPKLCLSADGNASVAPSVRQISELFGPFLNNLSDLAAIKTIFCGKRVSLIIDDKDEDEPPPRHRRQTEKPHFVVRYTDHVLSVKERVAFEQLMEEAHGIKVVSTEKRFARQPSSP